MLLCEFDWGIIIPLWLYTLGGGGEITLCILVKMITIVESPLHCKDEQNRYSSVLILMIK